MTTHVDPDAQPATAHRSASPRTLFLTWLALMLLAGISLVLRFAHLGAFSFPVALGIALVKALLVVFVFMELAHEKPIVRFAFLTGVLLLALMMTLMIADVLTRAVVPIGPPPGTAERYRG